MSFLWISGKKKDYSKAPKIIPKEPSQVPESLPKLQSQILESLPKLQSLGPAPSLAETSIKDVPKKIPVVHNIITQTARPADHWVYTVAENMHLKGDTRGGIQRPNMDQNALRQQQQQQQQVQNAFARNMAAKQQVRYLYFDSPGYQDCKSSVSHMSALLRISAASEMRDALSHAFLSLKNYTEVLKGRKD